MNDYHRYKEHLALLQAQRAGAAEPSIDELLWRRQDREVCDWLGYEGSTFLKDPVNLLTIEQSWDGLFYLTVNDNHIPVGFNCAYDAQLTGSLHYGMEKYKHVVNRPVESIEEGECPFY